MGENAVILNAEDHTIADLPVDIVCNIFRDFKGKDLLELSKVCTSFAEIIGGSTELMNKIGLKAGDKPGMRLYDLADILESSVRTYQHLSLDGFDVYDPQCTAFFESHPIWKSLKLKSCNFKGVELKDTFLSIVASHLEELEYIHPSLDYYVFQIRKPSSTLVSFPKLKKLKCNLLGNEMFCTNLEVLELTVDSSIRIRQRNISLLKTNPGLQELILPYDLIREIFLYSSEVNDLKLNLKKLEMQKQLTDEIDWRSNNNFISFLKTQKDSLEELTVEWFACSRPRPHNQILYQGQGILLQWVINNPAAAPENEICVRSLNSIFENFKVIRKIIITDKNGFLMGKDARSVDCLNLITNKSITELRLRFDKSTTSDILFKKLVAACPNLKNLIVREIDQSLLEFCSLHLKNLEHIYALTFKASSLPHPEIKFKKLTRISFCEIVVSNRPELQELKLVDQKREILKMIS